MSLKRDSIITALLITLVISIPAAAETVQISSQSNNFFQINEEGKFGSTFSLEFSNATRNSEMETTDYAVQKTESPEKQIKKYRTPRATLKITLVNSTMRKERITTPYGTLTTGVRNGRRFEEFEGLNRTKVEKIRADIKEKIQNKVTELEKRETKAIRSELPELEFDIVEGEQEYVNITNKADETVDLSGWRLHSASPSYSDSYNIKEVEIEPGQTYSFYTGEGPMKVNAVYETGMTLYSDSGKLAVYTDEGLKYVEITYS